MTQCLQWVARVALLLTAAVALTACGAIISTPSVNTAALAVEQARLEYAEAYAVYEYVLAVEYLHKAEEEWAYSDYQHAEAYALRAIESARAARERAIANPNRGLGFDVDPSEDPYGDFGR